MVEKYLDEMLTDEVSYQEVVSAFKKADHFYVTHYCKKRERIESRRCYWDDKSKIWETKDDKIARKRQGNSKETTTKGVR